jgi:hypothetical protein
MNIKAGNSTTPITIHQSKDVINVESKSTHINVNSDSAIASVVQAILTLKQSVANIDTTGAKESTLLQGIADLKNAFANIDLSSLETTLVSGLNEVKDAVNNIDFTDLENSIAEVKDAVANIDFSALAKEETLTQVQSKVEEVGNKIDNIKFPEIDTTELAKETTLNTVSSKLDNLNVEVDLSSVSKQGENQEATNTAIYDTLNYIKDDVIDIVQSQLTEVDNLLDF